MHQKSLGHTLVARYPELGTTDPYNPPLPPPLMPPSCVLSLQPRSFAIPCRAAQAQNGVDIGVDAYLQPSVSAPKDDNEDGDEDDPT